MQDSVGSRELTEEVYGAKYLKLRSKLGWSLTSSKLKGIVANKLNVTTRQVVRYWRLKKVQETLEKP